MNDWIDCLSDEMILMICFIQSYTMLSMLLIAI